MIDLVSNSVEAVFSSRVKRSIFAIIIARLYDAIPIILIDAFFNNTLVSKAVGDIIHTIRSSQVFSMGELNSVVGPFTTAIKTEIKRGILEAQMGREWLPQEEE